VYGVFVNTAREQDQYQASSVDWIRLSQFLGFKLNASPEDYRACVDSRCMPDWAWL